MKTLTLMAAILLALPLVSAAAEEAKPAEPVAVTKAVDPVEACKGKAAFMYHFDMMDIERKEWDRNLSHDIAGFQKQARHSQFLGESLACEELKND